LMNDLRFKKLFVEPKNIVQAGFFAVSTLLSVLLRHGVRDLQAKSVFLVYPIVDLWGIFEWGRCADGTRLGQNGNFELVRV